MNQMPKLSDLLQNLRIPEKQVEGMMKEVGITPPSGPAKMLVQQAESFEEKGGPFEGEFPFPTGEEGVPIPTGKEGIPEPPEPPTLELPTIEGLPEPLKQAGDQLKKVTGSLKKSSKGSKESLSPSEVKEGILRREGKVKEGILRT